MSSNRAGFGLIEAVVGVVIIGAASIGCMATIASHNDLAYRTRRQIEATALAEYRLNELGVLDRGQLSALVGHAVEGAFEDPFQEYSWSARVNQASGVSGIFDVAVSVRWSETDSLTLGTAYHRK